MVAGRPTENKLLKCYKFNFIRKHAGRALKLHRMAKRRGMGRKTGGQRRSRARKERGGRNEERPANLGSASICVIRGGFCRKSAFKAQRERSRRAIPHAAFASCLIRISRRKQPRSKAQGEGRISVKNRHLRDGIGREAHPAPAQTQKRPPKDRQARGGTPSHAPSRTTAVRKLGPQPRAPHRRPIKAASTTARRPIPPFRTPGPRRARR